MAIHEPASGNYEAEFRHRFEAVSPAGDHVIVQGSVYTGNALVGNQDDEEDETDNEYDVRLLVGPFWRNVKAVVPSVTINGFWNSDADDDDQQKGR